jgi:thiamine kinase-like enzyme
MKFPETKFTDIPREFLKRHYGVENFSNLSNINFRDLNIGNIPGKLIFISADNKLGNEELKIFEWKEVDSLNLGFPFTDNFGLMIQVLKSLNQKKYGELELTAFNTTTWNFTDFQPISIDVTNIHFLVKTDTETLRFKWYSRPEKGFREYQLHEILASLNFVPEPVLMLSYDNNAIFGLYKEISSIENLDNVTGNVYAELVAGKIKISEFNSKIKVHLSEIAQLILQIMNLDKKPNIHNFFGKYDKEVWKQILYSNWEGIIESKIYNNLIEQNLTNNGLPLLANFLEHTRSSVVHGDIWLRQFGFDKGSKQYYLFDFEEMSLGPRAFDIASILSSLLQQFEYFRLKKPNHEFFTDKSADRLVAWFLTNIPFITESFITEIKNAQCIRMIHELNYLIHYQPNERWLIQFLKEQLRKSLSV